MNLWGLIIILGSILASTAAFVWVALRLGPSKVKKNGSPLDDATAAVETDVEHIFNDEFREELRNRGRLHFEKIIGENAMFLQQDLRLTTSQLNDYMKQEITKSLQEAFAKYEESIGDAKQLAIDSIAKTQEAVEQQRVEMGNQLQAEVGKEKARIIARFEENLGDIVNHYLLIAIGDQIDLKDQLNYIIGNIESNKAAIIRDITDGS
ncbi:hypothetical protein H0X10_02975 [Candidatus Saccharibacteria bacterium]|nr:hypothetical protein [Candidatus Saccharibacteria bacterium]